MQRKRQRRERALLEQIRNRGRAELDAAQVDSGALREDRDEIVLLLRLPRLRQPHEHHFAVDGDVAGPLERAIVRQRGNAASRAIEIQEAAARARIQIEQHFQRRSGRCRVAASLELAMRRSAQSAVALKSPADHRDRHLELVLLLHGRPRPWPLNRRARPRELDELHEVLVVRQQVRLHHHHRQRRHVVAGSAERPRLSYGHRHCRQDERRRAEGGGFQLGQGQRACLDPSFRAAAERQHVAPRLLEQHDVAGPLDRSREQCRRRARAPLVKHQVERDRARSLRRETLEQLRVQIARPSIELGRLADGARRVARDADDDDFASEPATGPRTANNNPSPRLSSSLSVVGSKLARAPTIPSTTPSTSVRRRTSAERPTTGTSRWTWLRT